MGFIATSGKYVAFIGKHTVYVAQMRSSPPRLFIIKTLKVRPPQNKMSLLARNSLTNVDISRNSKFLCTSTTDKHVLVYERIGETRWDFQYSFQTEKRIFQLRFDSRCSSIIIVDKCGDIWVNYMSMKTIKTPTKILSPSSIILDTIITNDNRQIFMCDSDNKIMTSNFPESYTIGDYFLGHKTPVVGIAFVEQENLLVSLEAGGKLKLWSRGESRQCLDTYDVLSVCNEGVRAGDTGGDACSLKVTQVLGRIWLAIKIFGSKEIPILKLKYLTREICKAGQIRMESELCDMVWNNESLYIYMPESSSILQKFQITEHGLMCDPAFLLPKLSEYSSDIRGFIKSNKTAYLASLQRLSMDYLSEGPEDEPGPSPDLLNIEQGDDEGLVYEEEDQYND